MKLIKSDIFKKGRVELYRTDQNTFLLRVIDPIIGEVKSDLGNDELLAWKKYQSSLEWSEFIEGIHNEMDEVFKQI